MSALVDGDPKAPILIVGMAPGREELQKDLPFVGGAGWLLWTIGKAAGFTRADCYIVNVIGEWPAKKNGDPSAAQITKWRGAFEAAIARSEAQVAIPLGGVALTALCGFGGRQLHGGDGIEAWRGYLVAPSECPARLVSVETMGVYKTSKKGKYAKGDPRVIKERVVRAALVPASVRWVVPTLHPSGVLRVKRKTLPAFKADLERAVRAWKGTLRPMPKFHEARDGVIPLDPGPFCIDLETVPYMRVGAAGYYNGEYAAWSAPLDSGVRKSTESLFQRGSLFVAHNAPFDLVELEKHNMPWRGAVWCTMMAAAMLQPDLYKGLNEVASLYFDRSRWKHRAEEDQAGYNLDDSKTEFLLYEVERRLLKQDGMLELFETITMPAMIKALVPMTTRGVNVHAQRREAWLDQVTNENERLVGELEEISPGLNPRSPQQLNRFLYQKLGLTVQYSKKGSETAERAALMTLLHDMDQGDERRKVIEVLLAFRKNNTLLRNFAKRPIGDDGRIHPHWLPITKDSDSDESARGAAGTGRIQARPNVQQLPASRGDQISLARQMIISSREDQVLISADFKQLELRLAAVQAQDLPLLDALEQEDVFAVLSDQLKCDRTRTKNTYYGSLFHGGPRAICHALKGQGVFVPEKEIRAIQDAMFSKHRALRQWLLAMGARAAEQYYLVTPYGRRRYFYQGAKDAPAAVNFMTQGPAADIIWESLPMIEQAMLELDGAQLLTVHDESVNEVPASRVDDAAEALTRILGRELSRIAPGFRVPVEIKVGPNWGEMKVWTGGNA